VRRKKQTTETYRSEQNHNSAKQYHRNNQKEQKKVRITANRTRNQQHKRNINGAETGLHEMRENMDRTRKSLEIRRLTH